ncbi:MAG: DUF72 domain-containing protein [Acidobacteria bacterium]|nr:DUF72 domain-containing protein [Acidobacteriota bacterium]
MPNLSLFEEPRPLAAKLKRLAERGIFIGTSSWKYEGWLGQIYSPERYFTRGKFSQKKFDDTCLEEYGETFPAVCGDFSFYQFPSDEYWRKLFGSAPATLQFAFKVPEEITVKKWPTHARYGRRAGLENENFLNPEVFTKLFLEPLTPYGKRAAVFIFEFGTFAKSAFPSVHEFLAALEPFLAALPRGPRYSVEIRNAEYLCPEYFALLRKYETAHVFNGWTRMPDLPAQTKIEAAYTAGFTVTRALLRRGRAYEEAVQSFSPYNETKDPVPESREALRELIQRSLGSRRPAYIFVNNRFEGNAPRTIEAIVEDIEP